MKKYVFGTFACLAFGLLFVGFTPEKSPAPEPAPAIEMKWYTWAEAVEANKTAPKKMMVDVYTDWCGWCKKMDKSTFVDPAVVEYMAANFYPVKLDAEQKADILFNGETFKFVNNSGNRGVHTLAYSLLDGQMGYPTIVYLSEKYERILISPGYKDVPMLLKELKFTATEAYATKSWEEFKAAN